MSLIGKSKHLTVATAITIGGQAILLAVGKALQQAAHLLAAIAIRGEKATGQPVMSHLNLCAEHTNMGEERLHPVVDRGTDDDHLAVGIAIALQRCHTLFAQYRAVVGSKLPTMAVKLLKRHASEEMGKHLLLRFVVGITVQFHQHQQGRIPETAVKNCFRR